MARNSRQARPAEDLHNGALEAVGNQSPMGIGSKSGIRGPGVDTVSTGSGSDLVNDASHNRQEYLMLIADQVATAPCTDPIQARRHSLF